MPRTPSAPGSGPHTAVGDRTALRPVTLADGPEFTAQARRSTALHRPWLFPPQTDEAYAAWAGRLVGDPDRAGYLVHERATGELAGFLTVNNIVGGAFQCGALGYGAFTGAAGRGLMGEALGLLVGHAFGPLGLHRLEANIQPGNAASIGLVRAAGFRLEGFSPDFLCIDGAWRDHQRWALTREMTASDGR
ncbi:GNAT family N-acetyltransferase [Streptomyces genisteinicus]|uniref:GNAT family N-acetyltransferase n=1 Tax=Streptomyces genisteinicus TaxID=2768068 RepID=A0A7H0I0G6_9ACTN|nr:GNAT family protein [Streptomyces genisteinicus]QNP66282.1 GNAT family N-acetyltransferase [Streptomyces genisteinicus]